MPAFPRINDTLQRPLHRRDFKIAIICALPLEASAVQALFDVCWNDVDYGKAPGDPNVYTTGRIGRHNVVLAHMPGMGKGAAASVAASFRCSYQGIQLALVVGICGGVPFVKEEGEEKEIVLGDVVISEGVVQYDFGRRFPDKFVRKDDIRDNLSPPNAQVRSMLSKLEKPRGRQRLQDRMSHYLAVLRDKTGAVYPGTDKDKLFDSSYRHKHQDLPTCDSCTNCRQKEDPVCYKALKSTCQQLHCDEKMLLPRRRLIKASRGQHELKPIVHFGLIASGDTVMKSGQDRDEIAAREGVIAFEMEGAGVWDNFPCVVIKGVCDYADSHKNKDWQKYAAATAAACMKAFLEQWIVADEPITAGLSPALRLLCEEPAHLNQIIASKRQSYLDSLAFPQIDARLQSIKKAHDRTCMWLLEQPEYRYWLDPDKILEHNGFLWIKGKPGVGKSTIMKYALAHAKEEMTDATVISFFFNSRGEVLERSTLGMYRSLLFQLLTAIPEVQNQFDTLASTKQSHGDGYQWHIEELKDIFTSVIRSLGSHRLCCFIDALDECREDEVRDMVDFLEELGRVVVASGTRLYICLSSRHYPHISMEKGIQLIMEDQPGHHQDIERYVHSELRAGRGKQVNELKSEILNRASGVFLWVFLIVQILNKAYDRGQMHALRRCLNGVPNELDDLFSDILTRDDQNKEELVLCLQWILYAQRPLKRAELYFAIRSGIEPTELTEWDRDEITEEDMGRFILSCSKGLVETRTKDRTVRFIHESVRDYLMRNGLAKFAPDLGDNVPGLSHERLKQCCYNYIINIDRSQHVLLKAPLPRASSKEPKNPRKLVSTKFPFLEYAVHNIFNHADAAESHGVSQKRFLETFFSLDADSSALRTWITLENLFERHEIRRHIPEASLLDILADEDLAPLLWIQLERENAAQGENEVAVAQLLNARAVEINSKLGS
ncbi:hypothetical protein M432DRAFT_441334 [Thermoascus aurantiacus ATCC 26904]